MRSPKTGLVAALALAALLVACGKPVPPDRSDYVGEWRSKTMYLLITQDGSVAYKRLKGGVTTTITAPIQRYTAEGFEVGLGPFTTTFRVSRPPWNEGGVWRMVVDGEELTRTGGGPGPGKTQSGTKAIRI